MPIEIQSQRQRLEKGFNHAQYHQSVYAGINGVAVVVVWIILIRRFFNRSKSPNAYDG